MAVEHEPRTLRGTIRIAAQDRRCRPGSRVLPGEDPYQVFMSGVDDVAVSQDSEEARLAGSRFDPSQPPLAEDAVPLNCVWSCIVHPGPPPESWPLSLARRRRALGNPAGRTYAEIAAYLGEPLARDDEQFGTDLELSEFSMALWESRWAPKRTIIYVFDVFDVCLGDLDQMIINGAGAPKGGRGRRTARGIRKDLRAQVMALSHTRQPPHGRLG